MTTPKVPPRWMTIHDNVWGSSFRPLQDDLYEAAKAEATPATEHVHIWSDEDGTLHIERMPVPELPPPDPNLGEVAAPPPFVPPEPPPIP